MLLWYYQIRKEVQDMKKIKLQGQYYEEELIYKGEMIK